MPVKIKKIIIDVDGNEIALTPEQMQGLKRELNELIPDRQYIPYYPYTPPVYESYKDQWWWSDPGGTGNNPIDSTYISGLPVRVVWTI